MKLNFISKVLQIFTRVAIRQEGYGIKKYGKPLDPMDRQHDWLNMTIEELVDGFKYLLAERERRDILASEGLKRIAEIREIVQNSEIDSSEYEYINLHLNSIEGIFRTLTFNLEKDDIHTEKFSDGQKIRVDL